MSIGLSDMRAAFASQSIPVQTGYFTLTPFQCCRAYQLLRCWSSIETALSKFHVSVRVLALMPPQHRFPTLES